MNKDLEIWQREQYAPEGYNFEPELMQCGHNMTYRCEHCRKCYACKHKPALQRQDGSWHWKCWNGRMHKSQMG